MTYVITAICANKDVYKFTLDAIRESEFCVKILLCMFIKI